MKHGSNEKKHLGREYLVKLYGGDPKRNAEIVAYNKEGKTNAWIGKKYGITPQRVSKIIKSETRC